MVDKVLPNIDEAIGTIVTKLSAVVDAHGVQAIELGGRVLQMQAMKNILWPIILIPFLYICWRIHKFIWTKWDDWDDEACMALTIICGIISAALLISIAAGFIDNVLDPINWATLYDWKIGIAARIVGKL